MTLRIVISGLTAAGKTTHAKLLASEFDLPVYSASSFFARRMSQRRAEAVEDVRWRPSMDALRAEDSSMDDELDAYMIAALRETSGGVFDGCLLPWLDQASDCTNVWIESGLPSRVRKCIVSHPTYDSFTEVAAGEIVRAKDEFTAGRLKVVCGATFRPEPRLFDLVISNDDLLPIPTRENADRGIAAFHPVLLSAVRYLVGEKSEQPDHRWIIQLGRDFGCTEAS